ncbi:MAG: GtrA family protein [Treponema sp.]|uniref:GtrA family protein n=1 Tax=Treponema sp. TaxID=166 RepID=UPI001B7104FF|nr:GtrA family protein [Treponema sp.]MBP5403025.1 GtrA family protein [Treponema sp.]MBR5934244.1 GtrA family protein [Treponema sp.]
MRFIDKKLLKFLLVGVINTAVGAGIMFLLYNAAHLGYWFSSACNYIAGGIVSFFLNKYFTFTNHEKSFKQIILFIANLLICYVLAYMIAKKAVYALLYFKEETFRANIAMLCGMCLYTILNYFGQRLLVFADKEEPDENK